MCGAARCCGARRRSIPPCTTLSRSPPAARPTAAPSLRSAMEYDDAIEVVTADASCAYADPPYVLASLVQGATTVATLGCESYYTLLAMPEAQLMASSESCTGWLPLMGSVAYAAAAAPHDRRPAAAADGAARHGRAAEAGGGARRRRRRRGDPLPRGRLHRRARGGVRPAARPARGRRPPPPLSCKRRPPRARRRRALRPPTPTAPACHPRGRRGPPRGSCSAAPLAPT